MTPIRDLPESLRAATIKQLNEELNRVRQDVSFAIDEALGAPVMVMPVLVTAQPGIGMTAMLQDEAKRRDMPFVFVRCDMLYAADFHPVRHLAGGEVKEVVPNPDWLRALLEKEGPALLILDYDWQALRDSDSPTYETLEAIVALVRRDATSKVVVAFRTAIGNEGDVGVIAERMLAGRAPLPIVAATLAV